MIESNETEWLKKELKTALSLIEIKYGNQDADVWEWVKRVSGKLQDIQTGEEHENTDSM